MNDTKREDMKSEGKQAGGERSFGLQRIYLKDVSFESPMAPMVFQGEWKPSLNVNIATRARQLEGDLHEVVLTVTVEAKQDDKIAFLVELQQAGIFLIAGFSTEEKQQIAGILCPQNLFPFAREEIANLTLKGGFPQILLQPINFERIYQQGNQPPAGEA